MFCLRNQKRSLDRLGDSGPHQHVGGRQENAQNRPHFFQHIQKDGRPGLLQDTRSVSDEAQEAEIKFQAVLPKQVCKRLAARAEGDVHL